MHRSSIVLICSGVALATAAELAAQQSTAASETAAQPAQADARDPDAMAALDRMGAALGKLKNFSVTAEVTNEDVLTTGQKLQFGGTLEIQARRPNGFKIDVVSDRIARTFYYDGKNLSVVAPRLGYYATVAAPPTIRETLDLAGEKYALEFPLADLFSWGANPELAKRVTSAFRVGTETIGGETCEQYAMRQEAVDWQVWIREGAEALPCKIVITTTDDPSMPQYTAVLTWKPQAGFAADTFTYTPPANSRKIALGTVPAQTQK